MPSAPTQRYSEPAEAGRTVAHNARARYPLSFIGRSVSPFFMNSKTLGRKKVVLPGPAD